MDELEPEGYLEALLCGDEPGIEQFPQFLPDGSVPGPDFEVEEFLSSDECLDSIPDWATGSESFRQYYEFRGRIAELEDRIKAFERQNRALRKENKEVAADKRRIERAMAEMEQREKDFFSTSYMRAVRDVEGVISGSKRPRDMLRVPPQDIEVEQKVLGMLLNNPEARLKVSHPYLNKMMYRESHHLIHQAIMHLGQKTAVETVAAYLKGKQQLDRAGGVMYLSELQSLGGDIRLPEVKIDSFVRILEEAYIAREFIAMMSHGSEMAFEPQNIPSMTEFIRKFSGDILRLLPYRYRLRFDADDEVDELEDEFEKTIARHGRPIISSGYKEIDDFTYGILPNRLILVGARPKVGKTTLAINLMDNVSQAGHAAIMFSYELTRQEIMQMMAARRSMVDRRLFLSCESISDEERQRVEDAAAGLRKAPFKIYDVKPSVETIIELSHREKAWNPNLDMVIVDTLQSFEGYIPYQGSKTDIYSEVIKKLKNDIARELGVTVILTAQLKQQVERYKWKRPKGLDDFADCKGAGELCDLAVLLYRPELYWPENNAYKGWMELIYAGSRFGQAVQSRKISCDLRYSLLCSRSRAARE